MNYSSDLEEMIMNDISWALVVDERVGLASKSTMNEYVLLPLVL